MMIRPYIDCRNGKISLSSSLFTYKTSSDSAGVASYSFEKFQLEGGSWEFRCLPNLGHSYFASFAENKRHSFETFVYINNVVF